MVAPQTNKQINKPIKKTYYTAQQPHYSVFPKKLKPVCQDDICSHTLLTTAKTQNRTGIPWQKHTQKVSDVYIMEHHSAPRWTFAVVITGAESDNSQADTKHGLSNWLESSGYKGSVVRGHECEQGTNCKKKECLMLNRGRRIYRVSSETARDSWDSVSQNKQTKELSISK